MWVKCLSRVEVASEGDEGELVEVTKPEGNGGQADLVHGGEPSCLVSSCMSNILLDDVGEASG